MSKREKVPATRRPITAEAVESMLDPVRKQLRRMTAAEGEKVLSSSQNMGRLEKVSRELVSMFSFGVEISLALERWEKNYHILFGKLVPSFVRIHVPQKPEGVIPVRLIVVAEELLDWTRREPKQGIFNAMTQHYPCWKYTSGSLDETVPEEFDERKLSELGTHAFWVRDVQEDANLANKSANDVHRLDIPTEGLLDRELHEWDYFQEHEDHLDVSNWTLCSGSRDWVGYVPFACWAVRRLNVRWVNSISSHPHLRSRRVWG